MRTSSSIGIIAILFTGMATTSWGQTPWPAHLVEDQDWTSGSHSVAVTPPILSPGSASHPVSVSGTAQVEFVSARSILLKEGLYAGDFSGYGFFEARIDTTLGADADVVAVSPELLHHFGGNILHVPKWEKLEVGVRLPQDYRDAIDRFFDHYYSDPDPYVATPDSVDAAHDLNPYADDSLQLVMRLTSPSGAQTLKWGFFMREGKWAGTSDISLPVEDTANTLYPYHIRFRMAPDEEGDWLFSLSLNGPHTSTLGDGPLPSAIYTGYTFHCDPPLPDNKGPLEVNTNNRRTLQFEDGTPFFGLGLNLDNTGHGPGLNSYHYVWSNFKNQTGAMKSMHEVGANFGRIFLGSLTPVTENMGVYDRSHVLIGCGPDFVFNGNGQTRSWAFDQLLDSARQNEQYIQLCITPYPPIIDYQTFAWIQDPFLHTFVEPRDSVTGLYDMTRYFYTDGDITNKSSGALYFWKRSYKYILSRWGWSVNIPIIEPFNEIDQMLTYQHVNRTPIPGDPNPPALCAENKIDWPADTALPGVLSQWLTDIIHYVRDPVELDNHATSSLGYDKKLFLMSYTEAKAPINPDTQQPYTSFFRPFSNPDVDINDVHHGLWGTAPEETSNSYEKDQAYRDNYIADGHKKPFHNGEYNTSANIDLDGNPNNGDEYECYKIFDNYDVSFHNELWSSAFFGNFASGTTWLRERVFWWMTDVEKNRPPDDDNNPFYGQYPRTAALYGVNALVIPGDSIPLLVENRTLYHHFKPLSDFLKSVALGPGGFFDQDHEPRKVYDDEGKLECYYLVNADSTSAIGWVHNLNAYWENHYYVNNQHQFYLACTSPDTQMIALPGLQSGIDYQVTWYPTRMNMSALPTAYGDTAQTGIVTLDLSTLPLNGIHSWPANDNLDTLRSDYAFMIHAQPVHRMVPVTVNDSLPNAASEWDFGLYPNPTTGVLNVLLPSGPPVDLSILDMAGRQVLHLGGLSEGRHRLDLKNLVSGVYSVRATSGIAAKNKLLIKR